MNFYDFDYLVFHIPEEEEFKKIEVGLGSKMVRLYNCPCGEDDYWILQSDFEFSSIEEAFACAKFYSDGKFNKVYVCE